MTFAEMAKISKAADKHYFDKESLEYWGSKFECDPNANNIFVESIDDFYQKERLYNVVSFTLDGQAHTIKPMQVESSRTHFFPTLQSALDFRDKLSDCIDGQPNKCKNNLDGTYTFSFANDITHTVDTNLLYNDMLAEYADDELDMTEQTERGR